jgi:hypothetical protein
VKVFSFYFFLLPLEKKSGCWRDRSRNGCQQQENVRILAEKCSCATKAQKKRGKLEIRPTCGVKAAMGECRVT